MAIRKNNSDLKSLIRSLLTLWKGCGNIADKFCHYSNIFNLYTVLVTPESIFKVLFSSKQPYISTSYIASRNSSGPSLIVNIKMGKYYLGGRGFDDSQRSSNTMKA